MGSVNDPISPFAEDPSAHPHGNAASSPHTDDGQAAKIVAFCNAHAPGEGEAEGRSAVSPEVMAAAGKSMGLSGSVIQTILALVQQFGPDILKAIPQILALLKKTPTPAS